MPTVSGDILGIYLENNAINHHDARLLEIFEKVIEKKEEMHSRVRQPNYISGT